MKMKDYIIHLFIYMFIDFDNQFLFVYLYFNIKNFIQGECLYNL